MAAAALGLPLSAIYIAETATDKVPNASSTAASASSDLYGSAGARSTLRRDGKRSIYGLQCLKVRARVGLHLRVVLHLRTTCGASGHRLSHD